MYAKGMTTRDISAHPEEIYGIDASYSLISRITDKIISIAQEWQNRHLDSVYPIVFLDAIHYKVRYDGKVVNKAAYIILGISMSGQKDILGIWIGENESSKYWLKVFTELKNRGVKDIYIAAIDGLVGFNDAIRAVYPDTEIQRCIIHQIRNSTKSKSIFPSDEALLKMLYLATQDVLKRWTQNLRGWAQILAQLSIYFEERFDENLI